MGEMAPLIGMGVSAAGAKAGQAFAGDTGSGSQGALEYSTPNFINQMNQMLQNSMLQGINSSTAYTNQAIGQQNNSLQQSLNLLSSGLTNATNQATGTANQGLKSYQNLQSPYAASGYAANDAYLDSLGLKRPKMGSQAIVSALEATRQADQSGLFKNLKDPSIFNQAAPTYNGPAAPDYNTYYQQAKAAMPTLEAYMAKGGYTPQVRAMIAGDGRGGQGRVLSGDAWYQQAYNSELQKNAQALFNPVNAQYLGAHNGYLDQVNQYNTQQQQATQGYQNAQNFINQSGYTPQQAAIAAAYNKGLFQ